MFLWDNDKLEWFWSVSQQWALYDNHDAKWIGLSQTGLLDEVEFRHILKAYSIHRGKGGKVLAENFSSFWCAIRKSAEAFPPNPTALEVQNIWDDLVATLYKKSSLLNGSSENGFNYRSASAKLLWFLVPERMTMYDSYAALALDATPGSFMQKFYEKFHASEPDILAACRLFRTEYPYKLRILDKYLWLQGAEKKKLGIKSQIIENFKKELERFPPKWCSSAFPTMW